MTTIKVLRAEAPRATALRTPGPASPDVAPAVGNLATLRKVLGVSTSTIRRRLKDDPSFPRPFRLRPGGHLLWRLEQVRDYVAAKAAEACP